MNLYDIAVARKLSSGGGGGISGLCTVTSGTLDKSYNDLLGMLNNGVIPYIVSSPDASTHNIYTLMALAIDGDYCADWYSNATNEAITCIEASADANMSFD